MALSVDLGLAILGYLCGSLPFAVWITRWLKGTDVRLSGSGHATTTNTIRQVGWSAGILVFLMDILKGFAPVYLASTMGSSVWVTSITAALTVAGHCWPLFAGFRGVWAGYTLEVRSGGEPLGSLSAWRF
jgi:glycerol-3-phosphate acyltransferase PlsY